MALSENSLGKSLSNVFAKTSRREAIGGRGYTEVDINLIRPPEANPRQHFDPDALAELAESIRMHGLLQPIVVLRQEGAYQILAGERRWRACKSIGLAKVPVVVKDELSEEVVAELRLIENIQREDLNAIELAEAYQQLVEQFDLTQEQVAERVGKKRSSIANSLRLLELPDSIRQLVQEGSLSMGHARCLLGLTQEHADKLAQQIIAEGLSVRAVEKRMRAGTEDGQQESPAIATDINTPAATGKGRRVKPSHIRELEGNLSRHFDAEVDIKERGGKGSMTIRFHSKGHFQSVLDQLLKAFESAK